MAVSGFLPGTLTFQALLLVTDLNQNLKGGYKFLVKKKFSLCHSEVHCMLQTANPYLLKVLDT